MLAGDGLTVRDFIVNARRNHAELDMKLYSHTGESIYGEKEEPPPDPEHMKPQLRKALAAREPYMDGVGVLVSPIANGPECLECHAPGETRGVLMMAPSLPAADDTDALMLGFAEIIASAFERMMTVGAQEHLGTYFEAIGEAVPGIENSAVFSLDGVPSIGDGFMEVPASVRAKALEAGPPFVAQDEKGVFVATPLANKPSCNSCHDSSRGEGMRGAIITHFDAKALQGSESLRSLSVESVRHVMLTGLGRILHRFLLEVTDGRLTGELRLYDPLGRVFHDSGVKINAPEHIVRLLNGGEETGPVEDNGRLVFAVPLPNESKCQRCHTDDHPVRAVIEVAIPLITD